MVVVFVPPPGACNVTGTPASGCPSARTVPDTGCGMICRTEKLAVASAVAVLTVRVTPPTAAQAAGGSMRTV